MKYNVGDKVRIKSLDWYNENKDEYGYINCGSRAFFTKMSNWCGKIATIKEICKTNCYRLEEYDFDWTDEMIEGLVEEEIKSEPKFHIGDWATDGDVLAEDSCIFIIQKLGDNGTAAKTYCTLHNDGYFEDGSILYFDIDSTKPATEEEKQKLFKAIKDNGYKWNSETKTLEKLIEPLDVPTMTTDFVKEHGLPCPQGYIFKDENGNVINATKIVLEKKPDDKLKLESTKKVREYWSEYARIYIEIYDDEPNECVLTHLYTLEGHRQKGYGRQALIEAESIAKELGCHTAYLKVETNSWMHEWYLRMGYKWYKTADKEYTWLVKNLTSIEEKKKEYPKTYEECYKIMGVKLSDCYIQGYKSPLLEDLQELLICRDAYWKIAGEEMGLGKPWSPDWDAKDNHFYTIHTFNGKIECSATAHRNAVLIFPTEEMRDAFYEVFREEIEICKELL